ncbi:MAG TPA: lysine 5,6-aminomutase subunit alpha, partial [Spirochaetales bacterium]|nr:lysine 5,6-aminomutase subunit alpha [Spirochaetales bacterium]
MQNKLHLSAERVAYARRLAAKIAEPVAAFIGRHSSVTVERATLRLAGADGANSDGVPVPNLVVDQLRAADPSFLEDGVLLRYVNALVKSGGTVAELNAKIAAGLDVSSIPLGDRAAIERKAAELVDRAAERIRGNRTRREAKRSGWEGANNDPLLYLIVATGNIHEDVKQATAAAEQGADVIAVIRTT